MIELNVKQGSSEWLDARRKYGHTASEAPVMMGVSPYVSRSELIKYYATGLQDGVSPFLQSIYDKGHSAEKSARILIEEQLGEELWPIVGVSDDSYLFASFDGLTMDGTTGFEHKLWNEKLASAIRQNEIPPAYYWQLEQQILVGGLEKILFVCSDGTLERMEVLEYRAAPGRAEQLLAGWRQFDEDVTAYQPKVSEGELLPTPTRGLPALSIRVSGGISVVSNLDIFGGALKSFVDRLNKQPTDDQEFADAEAAIKILKSAEDALKSAESSALAQTASVEELRRVVADYAELARTTRLLLEKTVKSRKDFLKSQAILEAKSALAEHVRSLNGRLTRPYLEEVVADFAGAAKSKRNLDTLREALNAELARSKAAANVLADHIQNNLNLLADQTRGYEGLFADAAQLVLKDAESLNAIIRTRLSEHQKKEAERERIRREEEDKQNAEQHKDSEVRRIEEKPIGNPENHWNDCHLSGPSHYECLKHKYLALQTRLTNRHSNWPYRLKSGVEAVLRSGDQEGLTYFEACRILSHTHGDQLEGLIWE